MNKRLLTGAACLALGLFALNCTKSDGGDADGEGGSGGDSGGSGGESSGGKGGSTNKGGSGGSDSGGKGGSAAGEGGSAGNAGSGGSEASGGTGGAANGSGGAGGAATGSGGMGGRRVFVIKHPTWDFENGVQGWDDGAVALGAAQCEHGRWTAGDPMVTTEEKKDGASGIVYDIDAAKSKVQYDAVGCTGAAKSNMALRVSGIPLVGAVDLLTLNSTARLLPTGTKIIYNLKSSVAGLPIQGYIIAPGPGWSNVNAVTEEGWMTLTHTLAADYKFGPGYNEIGIFIPAVPSDFKAKIYIDSVDIVLP